MGTVEEDIFLSGIGRLLNCLTAAVLVVLNAQISTANADSGGALSGQLLWTAAGTVLLEPLVQLSNSARRAEESGKDGGQIDESGEAVDEVDGEEGVLADELAQLARRQVIVEAGEEGNGQGDEGENAAQVVAQVDAYLQAQLAEDEGALGRDKAVEEVLALHLLH